MLSKYLDKFKYILGFFVLFLILGYYASALFIYLDDVSYIFPALTGKYTDHFFNYIRDNGFNRPFALFYYYSILKLYALNSGLAHLISLAGFISGGFILFKVLIQQGFKEKRAFFTALIALSMPFSAEIYSWFSASIGVWALLIFYLEVYMIEKFGLKGLNFILIFLLQCIVSFFYETTLFMAFPLAYLAGKKPSIQKLNVKEFIKNSLTLFFPVLIYLGIKVSVPHTIPSEFEISKFSEVITYFKNYVLQFNELFITKGPNLFWLRGLLEGVSGLFIAPFPVLLFLFFAYLLFIISKSKYSESGNLIHDNKIKFWLITLFFACLPLIWKKFYLPFRTLYLPMVILTILFGIVFSNLLETERSFLANFFQRKQIIIKLLAIFTIFYFLLIQISMLNNYSKQYKHDLKIVEEIRIITEKLGYNSNNRTNLVLRQMSPNTLASGYLYGDYILSAFKTYWTATGFIDIYSGTIKEVAIENKENKFLSKTDKESFMKLRPLTILKFKDIENCFIKKCFQIEYNAK